MDTPVLPRLGATCGAVFAIVLFVANGNGNEPFNGARAVAGLAALTLVIPFLCYPLAIFCAATAIVALRTRALPRWLGVGAATTAVGLAVNAGFLDTGSVPAVVLFILWTLLTSIHLFRINWRQPTTSPATVSG